MKKQSSKLFFVLALTILFATTLFSQVEWTWINPSPQGSDLNDIHVFDANNAVAVGNAGVVMKTTDGGDAWSVQTGVGSLGMSLTAVSFIDNLTGWAVGNDGTIVKTTDGGTTWSDQISGTTQDLYDIYLLDATTGWAVGSLVTILKTIDGGMNWTALTTDVIHSNNALYSVHFTDADTGWVGGLNGIIIKTTDGGTSWTEQNSGTTLSIVATSFIDAQTGLMTAGGPTRNAGYILRTTDGGTNWTIVQGGQGGFSFSDNYYDVHFITPDTAWAVGSIIGNLTGATILLSTDGGASWERIILSGLSTHYFGVSAANGHTGWAVGKDGIIAKTVDAWANLDYQRTRTISSEILDISFISAERGWLITSTTVYRTSDGGNVWEFLGSDNTGLKSVVFVDIAHGWIVGSSGNIKYTSSGGAVWVDQTSNTTRQLNDIYFIDLQNGWAVGAGCTILKTIDGGANWTDMTFLLTQREYTSVHFIDAQTGYVVGTNGITAKSVDGGTTWTENNIWTNNRTLHSVYFHDAQTGWTVGGGYFGSGLIFSTTDGGATWTQRGLSGSAYLSAVHFADSRNGLAVGNNGNVVKTGDGGISWSWVNWSESPRKFSDKDFYTIQFVDPQTAIVAGQDGIILSAFIKLNPSVANAIPDHELDEDFVTTVIADLDTVFADADSPSLAYSVVTDGYTTAEISGSLLSLSSILDYNGTSTVTVTATDEQPISVEHAVTVTVNSINDIPVLAGLPDLIFTEDDSTQLDLDLYVSDVDHDTTEITFTAAVIGKTAQGLVRVNIGSGGDFRIDVSTEDLVITIDGTSHVASFVTSADSSGVFTIVFTATDDSSATDTDTLVVTVSPENDLPVALDDMVTTAEDTAVYILVLANDYDVESVANLLIDTVWAPIHGTSAISNETVIYTPDPNYFGADTFSYVLSDGTGGLDTAKVYITVTSVNDAPILVGLPDVAFPEDSISAYLHLNEYVEDVDHDTLYMIFGYEIIGPAGLYVDYISSSVYYFGAESNVNGNFEVVFTVTDPAGAADTDTMQVSIIPINDPPGMFTAYSPENNTIISIDATNLDTYLTFAWSPATDPEGDTIRYGFELTGSLDSALPDTLFDSTFVNMTYQDIADYMLAAEAPSSILGTWTIYATDGLDTTFGDNDPLLLSITLGELVIINILELPQEFSLHQNFPNPFNPITTLRYDLPEHTNVNIIIYDMLGRQVKTLINQTQDAGFKSITWNATNDHGKPVSAGVYLYQIRAGNFVQTKKMILLK